MENLHLLFYKTLYDKINPDLTINDIKEKNKRLTDSLFYKEDYKKSEIAQNTFLLKTTYPGLLVGIGYAHGVSNNDDIKIGFSFDYVTGQPYIPGSSVKGIIKSIFSNHPEVIAQMLDCDESIVKDLSESIFGKESEKCKDVFFDAVIIRGDEKGRVVADDYITPHPSAIATPNPIKMLKVLPNVIFEFRFNLKDSVVATENDEFIFSADNKIELFKRILCEFGAGAKTNVGYGNLVELSNNDNPFIYPKTPECGEITETNLEQQNHKGKNNTKQKYKQKYKQNQSKAYNNGKKRK